MTSLFDLPSTDPGTQSLKPVILDGQGSGDASNDLLDGLNPEQREAVEYRGPALLIVAGAGSGKTSVLTHRVASLIESREA